MDLKIKDSNHLRAKYRLDSLTVLNMSEKRMPKSFKDYVMLSFRHDKGLGKHGLIWESSDSSFEMIIINNIGSKVGDTWHYKLSASFDQEAVSMLLIK
tara:strand:+ start:290 stop:583 length:294 start_codon:yes stop_codon:yes gene_type:complete